MWKYVKIKNNLIWDWGQVALTDAKPSHLRAALTAANPAHLKYVSSCIIILTLVWQFSNPAYLKYDPSVIILISNLYHDFYL